MDNKNKHCLNTPFYVSISSSIINNNKMFNKLISSLPFNPSLINQVSFYATRLKKEASVRRLGLILVVLVLIVQMFAVFSPAQPTLARDGNDIIPGGFSSKAQLVQYCNSNYQSIATILGHFGITCSNVNNNSSEVTLKSTDYANQGGLYSMGRQSVGQVNSTTGKTTNETPVIIPNTNQPYGVFFMRLLSSWDGSNVSRYRALSVGNVFGVQYFILFSCGNLVQKGKPNPPTVPKPEAPKPEPEPVVPTKPKPTPTKPCPASKDVNDIESCLIHSKKARNVTQKISNANGTTAKAGDIIEYTLMVKNTAKVTAKNVVVVEPLADVLEYSNIVTLGGAAKDSKGTLKWGATNIGAGKTLQKQFRVQVKKPIPQTPSPCPPNSTVKPCPRSSSFDLKMTNVYGNSVTIKLPPTVIKTTEVVTTTELPKTGPGTTLLVSFMAAAVVGYFYSRSRLLAKEVDIIRKEYSSSGGM
jgi:uncharacterized repeat protein (TIGR01451 family)